MGVGVCVPRHECECVRDIVQIVVLLYTGDLVATQPRPVLHMDCVSMKHVSRTTSRGRRAGGSTERNASALCGGSVAIMCKRSKRVCWGSAAGARE